MVVRLTLFVCHTNLTRNPFRLTVWELCINHSAVIVANKNVSMLLQTNKVCFKLAVYNKEITAIIIVVLPYTSCFDVTHLVVYHRSIVLLIQSRW